MLRTFFLSAVLALAGYSAAAWLTHGFQVWTAEGARRLEVALNPVLTPNVTIDGPETAAQPLNSWLADGRSVTVLDFAYTRCVSVCLALGSTFQQMQASLLIADPGDARGKGGKGNNAAQRVKLLTVSFDGQHDTPAVLRAYAARLNADPTVWRFLRATTPADTARLLAAFGVTVVPDGRGDFEHNAALLVIDQRARLVRVFDYTEHTLALAYARDLARNLAGDAPPKSPP